MDLQKGFTSQYIHRYAVWSGKEAKFQGKMLLLGKIALKNLLWGWVEGGMKTNVFPMHLDLCVAKESGSETPLDHP